MTGLNMTFRIITIAVLAVLLAGCGARGPLEPPPGAQTDPPPDPPFVLDKVI
ncbi:MAG: LPS translocon maturation chaperone LptM [Aestuariivirgaceae bacterium]